MNPQDTPDLKDGDIRLIRSAQEGEKRRFRAMIQARKRWDVVFAVVGLLAMSVGILTLVALFAQMVIDGAPRLSAEFFTSFPSRRAGSAGILSAWVGSLLVMIVTALFAIPVGIASAIYLESTRARRFTTSRDQHHQLAGVPSIVYGCSLGCCYTFGFGQSILSAGLTLALLILPIVIVATREALRAIPQTGARAPMVRRDQVAGLQRPLVPYGMPGILTG